MNGISGLVEVGHDSAESFFCRRIVKGTKYGCLRSRVEKFTKPRFTSIMKWSEN